MKNLAVLFLLICLAAGVYGFSGFEGIAGWIARTLFVIFFTLYVFSILLSRRRPIS